MLVAALPAPLIKAQPHKRFERFDYKAVSSICQVNGHKQLFAVNLARFERKW